MGQVAPGPNMMMIVVIGQWAAGVPGAIVVLIAFFGPTALLAIVMGRLWKHLEKWPWRTSIERGLSPVSIGLLLAGCLTLAHGAISGWMTAMIAVAVLLTLLLTKLNPAFLVLAGAVVGAIAYGPKL